MNLILDTWFLFIKYTRITLRSPMWALFTIIQPLIWLVFFGQLLKKISTIQGFGYQSYMDFFLPGVIIMTVLFGSSWSGINLLREINFGVVEKMLVTPLSRMAIVLSRILHSAFQVVLQCAIILIVALLLGTKVNVSLINLIFSMTTVFLLGVGFAALSNGFAIMLKREEPLVVIGNSMTLPLMFFSSSFVPSNFMPDWIRYLSKLNPVDYAVNAVRKILIEEWSIQTIAGDFIFVLFFATISLIIANYLFINSNKGE